MYHFDRSNESKKNRLIQWWDNAKFDFSIRAIFIFAVIVSFSHTIELYSSVGFDIRINLLNNLLGVDWFTLALFATLAAEASFAVGLWGLYEAYEQTRKFPSPRDYWQVWTLFGSGLIIVGWSNIGGTVGYNFLIGDPWKGVALGLSIPLFVLGAVLVNFKRGQVETMVENGEMENAWSSTPANMEKEMETPSNMEMDNLSKVVSSTLTMENRVENISKVETPTPENKMETTTQIEMENLSKMNPSTQNNVETQVENSSTPAMENVPPTLETTKVESVEEQKEKETPEEVESDSNQENSKIESGEIEPPMVENSPTKAEVEETPTENTSNMEKVEKKKVSKVESKKVENDNVERDNVERDPMEWTLSYHEEFGELPGRKKIVEGTSCTEWQARKVLTQLKHLKKAN